LLEKAQRESCDLKSIQQPSSEASAQPQSVDSAASKAAESSSNAGELSLLYFVQCTN